METNISVLINFKKVTELLKEFSKSTGFETAIIDLEGNILSQSGWRHICTEFHRVHPKTMERCRYSDRVLADKLNKGEKYNIYTCMNGLTDAAIPIKIDGQHVANLFSGQFLLEKPDIDFFKKQANTFGFEETAYIEALKKVPVVSEEKVKAVMNFLLQMTNLISAMGVEKAEQVELNKRQKEAEKKLNTAYQQLDLHNQQIQATEQQLRLTNQQLTASEEYNRMLFEISPIGLALCRMNGEIVDVNPAYAKIIGQTIEETLKLTYWDITPEKYTQQEQKQLEILKNNGKYGPYEKEYIHKDGHLVPVRLSGVLVEKDDKQCIWSTVEDITVHKQAEKLLKNSQDLLNETARTAKVGGWEINLLRDTLAWTDETFRIHELDRSEQPNVEAAINYYHPDDRSMVGESVQKSIETGESFEFEARLITALGNQKWVLAKGTSVLKNGSAESIKGIVQDITDRKQAEQKLKKSEERFEHAMKASNDGLFDWDLETNAIYYSPGWKKMIGYKDEELSNDFSVWEKTTAPEDVKKSWELQQKLISKEVDRFVIELKMKHKEGHWVDILSRAKAIFNDEGQAIRIVGTHTDITERKKIEKETNEREKLLSTIAKNYPNSYLSVINSDYTINFTSGQEFKKQNLDPKQFESLNIDQIFGEKAEFILEKYKKTFQGEEQTFEMFFKNQHQLYRTVPLNSEDGSIPRILSVVENITDRKQAEREITKQANLLDLIFQKSPDSIVLLDRDYNFIKISESYAKSCQRPVSDFEGRNHFELYPSTLKDEFDETIKQKKMYTANERAFSFPDHPEWGVTFWDLSAVPILDISGEIELFLFTLRDVTKRKAAEEQIRFLGAITENMHDAIITTDVQGQITYINKSAENLFGYTLNELVGKRPDLLDIDSKAQEIQAELYEAVEKGETYHGEALNRRKDGSEFICEFTVTPLTDEKGLITSYVGIQRDITELRALENASIRQERLSAIGELASGVAHDFNNALQIILGGVEMAMISEDPKEVDQFLQSIKNSASDAASRVRQLQRFSQKSQAQKENVLININTLIEEVIKETELYINQYQEKGVHIQIKPHYKAKGDILGDEGELRACLFNLIKNSVEAMPEGGAITICTKEHADKIYVSVSDTGNGMDSESQKKVFQPFYTTKDFKQGRGLGMAQVYSIVRDHNGEIYIKESNLGKGTVIEFFLPMSLNKSTHVKGEEGDVGTANILWVDDEEMICELGAQVLKRLGHTADIAISGQEALEFLAQGNIYDLVITDIGMPEMSGWELIEKIKEKGYTTKIAVLTGWGAEISEDEKNKYGVGYVLGKPILMKDLKALIGEVLQMKQISK